MNPVLLVDLAKSFGGAEVRVLALASALSRQRPYGVAVLRDSPLHCRLAKAGLNTLPIPLDCKNPLLLLSLCRMIKQYNFMVVDTHNPQSNLWGGLASAITGVKRKITTVHSTKDPTFSCSKTFRHERILQLNALMNAHFIAVSLSVAQYLTDLKIKREEISVVPNGVDLSAPYSQQHDLRLRHSLEWSANDYIVIVVGRLEAVKGHTFLIEALKTAVHLRPHLRCLIVGDGTQRAPLQELVHRLQLGKHVHFTGFREDVQELLTACDGFCMPSLSEGLPYALLEACAMRLPLLTTKVGGMEEILRDSDTAIMVPPGNASALAKGLLQLVDTPRASRRMSDVALHVIQQRFSVDDMTTRSLALYAGEPLC